METDEPKTDIDSGTSSFKPSFGLGNKHLFIFVAATTIIGAFVAASMNVDLAELLTSEQKLRKFVMYVVLIWFFSLFVLVPVLGLATKRKGFGDGSYPFLIFRNLPLKYKINLLINVGFFVLAFSLGLMEVFIWRLFVVAGITHLFMVYKSYRLMRRREIQTKW